MSDKKRILVIDDDPNIVDFVSQILSIEGYEVMTASDGLDGLEKLGRFHPHLIVLDMNMPQMSGIDFYSHLEKNHQKDAYPVLILTARANLEKLFREIQVDGFMSKPFEIEELVANVKHILALRYPESSKVSTDVFEEKNALIVEDDPEAASNIVSVFAGAGYGVKTVRTGLDAFKKISVNMPDVLIVKLNLADIPGDALLGKVKKIPAAKKAKIILYAPVRLNLDAAIAKNICAGLGISQIVETDDGKDLLARACEPA